MSKQDILSYFYTTSGTLTPGRMILLLAVALVGSCVIYAVYYVTAQKDTYNRAYNEGNVILALITCVVMMMISSNIVISLGMVGALSIVRFRTAVKNARDTLFFFWAMVLGLSVGSQNLMLSVVSTIFIGVILVLFSLIPINRYNYTLIVRCSENVYSDITATIDNGKISYKPLASNNNAAASEYVFSINGKIDACLAVVDKINKISGVAVANLVYTNL